MEKMKMQKSLKKYAFLILIIILAIICWRYYVFVSSFYIPNEKVDPAGFSVLNELGIFGNFFNGVSAPLFGFIALTLFAIYAQSDNQLEQTKIQQESTFVSIFNNMISEYRTSQLQMKVKKGKKRIKVFEGKDVFPMLNKEIGSVYKTLKKQYPTSDGLEKMSAEKLHIDYRIYYEQHFKLLYNILKYIDKKCKNDEDKEIYAGILRSFIPIHEEIFMFYEALQFDKFKTLLEKYSMMHDIDTNKDLIDPNHAKLYDSRAFV